jgi:hypothetical protein
VPKLFFISLLCVAFGAGCTSVSVRKPPAVDLSRYQRIFVIQPFNENHHVDEMFVDELKRVGKEAWSGPLTMMPENADAVLTYDARWTWDFKTYVIELTAELHTAHTNKKLADGRYYQPSARPKPPEVATREIVTRMFGEPATPAKR